MDFEKRRAVAFIAGALVGKHHKSFIVDLRDLTSHNITGNVSSKIINVYDTDRRNHLNGSSSDGENFTLDDYSSGSTIDLRVKGNHFSGFDGQSASKFEGSVGDKLITFYDEQDKLYHNYRLD